MDNYPLLEVFLTVMYFFLWVMWFFLLFRVITDVFRDHQLSGWAKAGWVVFVLVLPFIGALVYLGVRGRSMAERDIQAAQRQEEAFRAYIRKTADGSDSKIDQLEKLSKMKQKGELTQQEFELAKGQLLG